METSSIKNHRTRPFQYSGDIIKSATDSRNYRGLQLDNGMKVLLINDESTDKSAAALQVNVGTLAITL